ncbi:MAG: efflux RND transporter permease subunit, partial [Proteobacteria bacterium]|nr:efflux RND transporter permease subunit [Pseudomonadota bacterium]
VDDAIVMLENIVRHAEMGKTRQQAVMDGSREIAFTIVSMTLSLAAVFLPVFFMEGIVGRLFHEFAVTICSAVLISGLVSLTLTPMLCNVVMRPHAPERHGKLFNLFEDGFQSLRLFYQRTLDWTITHHRLAMIASLVVLVLTVVLFRVVPKGFLPSEDTGSLRVSTEAEQGVPFETMMARQQKLMEIVAKDEAVKGYMSVVGGGGPNSGNNSGRLMLQLTPRKERDDADTVLQRLRGKLSQVPGIRAFLSNPPPIRIGGRSSKGQYQYTLQSPNTEELFRVTAALEEQLREVEMLQDVTSDMELNNPELSVTIDRDRASALGVSAYQIENALAASFGNRKISSIYAPTDTYDVLMELAPKYQANPDALAMLSVRSQSGKLVRLGSVAHWTQSVGPLSINHSGQMPSATISFNLQPGTSLGTAVSEVEKLVQEVVPPSISTSFQGEAETFQDSMQGLWLLLLLSVLVIYLVLGVLYESFVHPLTILSGLPSAGVGALLTLMIFGVDLNIYGFVGIIMLIGIVKKNAIMMIDFAVDAQRTQGLDARAAIREGALVRFRPIMMTTMAALMGTLPIALGFGAGADARRPLGLAVVGGLLFSQLLTLYFTPVYYIYLDAAQRRIFRRKAD